MKENKAKNDTRQKAIGPGRQGDIVIYQAADGGMALDVRLEAETIWLSLNQMSTLFDRDKSVVSRHLFNIFKEKELEKDSTVAFFATVQDEGRRSVVRQIEFYNLDAIISVGYRVNSKRGTQFRIWATKVLREHLVKGYTANEKRLKELKQSLKLIENVISRYDVSNDEAMALLKVITDYSYALDVLDDYDHQRLTKTQVTTCVVKGISYEEAITITERLREKFGASVLFGKEKDKSLNSSLAAVMQTFDGRDVYPGFEEKAAHLLYFLVKNHSFIDGNKRIAAALFLWFMEKNAMLYTDDGRKRIADNALIAMTLMIAESAPVDKPVIINILISLINRNN